MEKLTKLDTIAEDIASIKKSQKSLAEQVKKYTEKLELQFTQLKNQKEQILACQEDMEVLRTNQDIITNEVQMLKSKLGTMHERIVSAGVDVSNVSRGSSIDAREIMERVRKIY
ncbi:hypothetical protein HHI36_018153 [Cryptolaemus montrouzieri]|uniref:Uncharacterized protein n=1 Tax=Cryptolaemus montrouzieri TaxID=559131 RepID=A0ABD2NZD3_9CUCU